MDELLKLAAEASREVSIAEEALDDDAMDAARDALDRARDALARLRERWPQMSGAERTVVGKSAGAVRERLDDVAARVPVRRTLSTGAAEPDPEEDSEPGEG
jgi:hypothetical protein